MSKKYYAQLDDNNIVVAVTECLDNLPGLDDKKKVEVFGLDGSLLGKKFDKNTSKFAENVPVISLEQQALIDELHIIQAKSTPTNKEVIRAVYLLLEGVR